LAIALFELIEDALGFAAGTLLFLAQELLELESR
jgi:hypothetical protein